jgi:hypothetical protein
VIVVPANGSDEFPELVEPLDELHAASPSASPTAAPTAAYFRLATLMKRLHISYTIQGQCVVASSARLAGGLHPDSPAHTAMSAPGEASSCWADATRADLLPC